MNSPIGSFPQLDKSHSGSHSPSTPTNGLNIKVKRTPKNLYKLPDENTPLLSSSSDSESPEREPQSTMPHYQPEEETDSQHPIVKVAIYVNLAANIVLLILKLIVAYMTASVSVLASLVDAALDFLSTAIIFITTRMIARQDTDAYPVGRRRLEPIGVLVFSVIMVTSFVQVAIEGLHQVTSGNQTIVQLTIPAVAIMGATVVIKFLCWLWCRLIKNSSVQALAQDAMTDVVVKLTKRDESTRDAKQYSTYDSCAAASTWVCFGFYLRVGQVRRCKLSILAGKIGGIRVG